MSSDYFVARDFSNTPHARNDEICDFPILAGSSRYHSHSMKDAAGRKRLRQTAKQGGNHEQRVQNIVFECMLDNGHAFYHMEWNALLIRRAPHLSSLCAYNELRKIHGYSIRFRIHCRCNYFGLLLHVLRPFKRSENLWLRRLAHGSQKKLLERVRLHQSCP